MHKCPKCGVQFDGKFCPECGEKWQEDKTCPNCGTTLQGATRFCTECGYAFYVEKANVNEKSQDKNNIWTKVVSLLGFSPSILFMIFSLLLFAFYAAPVAEMVLGMGFSNLSLGNVYSMESGILSEIPELKSAMIALIVFATSITVIALILFMVYMKSSYRPKMYVYYFIIFASYIIYLVVGAVIIAIINKIDEGANMLTAGACPILLIVFSIFFAAFTLGAILVRSMLLKKIPLLVDFKNKQNLKIEEIKTKQKEKYYATHREPAHISSNASKREKIIYKYQKKYYDKAIDKEPSKALIWFNLHKVLVTVVASFLVVVIVGLSISIPILTNKFRISVVEQIRIGGDKWHVRNIIGDPTVGEIWSDNTWYYYNNNMRSYMKKAEKNDEELKEAIAQVDKYNKLLQKQEKLIKEYESKDTRVIEIIFSDKFFVESVFLDCSYLTKNKYVENIVLTDMRISRSSTTAENFNKTVSIYYTDGSYYHGKVPATAFYTIDWESSNPTIRWSDSRGSYECPIKIVM